MGRCSWRTIVAFAALVFCLAGQVREASAQSACGSTVMNNHTLTVSPSATIASYNAFSGMAVHSFTVTLTRNNQGSTNCRLGIYIEGGRTTKTLLSGLTTLNYDMLRSGVSILFPSGVTPSSSSIALFTTGRNQSYSFNVSYEVPAGQVVPAGTYVDLLNEVVVRGVNAAGNYNGSTRRHAMATQATVIKSCQLGTPSATTLAFAASDIPNGLPNEGVIKSTNMSGSCTAPAILKLSGQALQPQIPTAPRPNFDNFINYTAAGSFNGANVTLNTTTNPQDVSSGQTGTANSVVSGTVSVGVNLKKNKPVIAGNYTGVLTVTLDAAP